MPSPSSPVPPEIAEQAVKWLVDLQDGPASDSMREAWERWRREDPEHEKAWRHIEALNERLKVAPGPVARRVLGAGTGAGRRRAIKLLALVAVGSGATWVAADPRMLQAWGATHRTNVGERRAFDLEDGTRMVLNTDSAVAVQYDGGSRTIRLLRGEILLTTAPDPSQPARPFLVSTDHGRLRALGTRFVVRLQPEGTRLSVFEGAVELRPVDRPDSPVVIPAGQQALMVRDGFQDIGPVVDGADAWENGMIVASAMPLGEFLAELSRYRSGRLSCAPEISRLPVSGTYPLGDTDRVLGALEKALPVTVRRFTRYWVLVNPRRA
jgi:transmembrane sensor